jgi:hypothetical protein
MVTEINELKKNTKTCKMNYMFESLVPQNKLTCEYVLCSKVTNTLDDEIV